jgi:hypothetical protein
MSDLTSDINGHRLARLSVHMPEYGLWIADASFPDLLADDQLKGLAVISVGNMHLDGYFLATSTGSFQLQSFARIIGGAGKMGTLLTRKHYHSDAGILVSTISNDAIREAGESLGSSVLTSQRVGVDYVRKECSASKVLGGLGVPWYASSDGKINIGNRLSREISKPYEIMNYDPTLRMATVTTDDPDALLPGSVLRSRIPSPLPIRELEFLFADAKLRIKAWCDGA